MVLKGVDGIVFVADAMAIRRKKNVVSLKNLQENLSSYNKSIFQIPCVLQYNKLDLIYKGIPIINVNTLEHDLNRQLKKPYFVSSALKGANVVETLKKL